MSVRVTTELLLHTRCQLPLKHTVRDSSCTQIFTAFTKATCPRRRRLCPKREWLAQSHADEANTTSADQHCCCQDTSLNSRSESSKLPSSFLLQCSASAGPPVCFSFFLQKFAEAFQEASKMLSCRAASILGRENLTRSNSS